MVQSGTAIEIGELIRHFDLPSTRRKRLSPGDYCGKSLVILFYLNEHGDSAARSLLGLRDSYQEFQKLGAEIIGISTDSESSQRDFSATNNLPFPLLSDPSGVVFRSFGAIRAESNGTQPALSQTAYLCGPDFKLVRAYPNAASPDLPARILADARSIFGRDEPRMIIRHAPVLILPNVLPPELCRDLIDLWQTHNGDSGFMVEVNGQTVGQYDYSHKIRRDHHLQAGELQSRMQGYISARIVPEIQTAFNFAVSRREDYRIACYDSARGGYFRPHRDNTTEGTAHRRFAMSLLLNDDYEGGHLRFPEFGGHLYRPDAGGAIIFSCSLLHEATDVTAGRRFVLISFFYGESDARKREEFSRKAQINYRA